MKLKYLYKKIKPFVKYIRIGCLLGGGATALHYGIKQAQESFGKIINPSVLEREKKYTSEYIYIDDLLYDVTIMKELNEQYEHSYKSYSLRYIWKNFKHSLIFRLLWLCQNGNKEQRNIALEQLAAFKNNKDWDCLKIAQAMDENTAVLLAHTKGADMRYFLPPPMHIRRAAQTSTLLCFKLHDMLLTLINLTQHICIEHFLSKHFANVQEQVAESDIVPSKPDRRSDRELCMLSLEALHHHLSVVNMHDLNDSKPNFISYEMLPLLAELFLRHPNDPEMDSAILKVLILLSVDNKLLVSFFQNGLIRELNRLIKSSEVKFASSAAVCLSNLSGECVYGPGLYILHPIYRTTKEHACDIMLVHGLRGGVFVTWRQRDKKCAKPVGIADDIELPDNNCMQSVCKSGQPDYNYIVDPELRQVMEELLEIKEEALLSDLEVVLNDVPENADRIPDGVNNFIPANKRKCLLREAEDRCNYTTCWPKEWLPQDCHNLRILGLNYWSSISDWLERCPLQPIDIESRANLLSPLLSKASVGESAPVVWLCHSMGGLIVKQLLVNSAQSEDENVKTLSKSTKAVLFFSTPHKGSAVATMPRAAAAVLWPSNDVKQLQENYPLLIEIHNSFINEADKHCWETISFAETKPTLVTAFKVPFHLVKPESADLGRGMFYALPLDHVSICKPATRESLLYSTILDVLLRITTREEEVQYAHSYFDVVSEKIMSKMHKQHKNFMDSPKIDQSKDNKHLNWIEKLLLSFSID